MNALIKSATVVDSKSDFHNQNVDILIENGIITKISKRISNPKNYQEIKLDNLPLRIISFANRLLTLCAMTQPQLCSTHFHGLTFIAVDCSSDHRHCSRNKNGWTTTKHENLAARSPRNRYGNKNYS